jgi:hypothetical protein
MPLISDFDLLAYPVPWTKANCPCCGLSCLDIRLHAALTVLDDLLPAQFAITSLTRCVMHNVSVGGARDSLHLYGRAADLAPVNITLYRLIAAALTTPAFESGGIGLYPQSGIIHVDVRPRPARWAKLAGRLTDFIPTWIWTFPDKPVPDSLFGPAHSYQEPSPPWR